MSVTDSSDHWAAIRELQIEVSRLKSGTMLESASIDRGGLTIRALEGLTIGDAEDPTGSGTVYGILRILGQLLLEGDMDVTGGGTITVGGVVITPLGGGRIQIGTGSSQVILDGATGKITAGNMTIDPTEGGGAIVFDNGAQLYSAEAGNQVELFSGQSHVTVREDQVTLGAGSSGVSVILNEDGLVIGQLTPLPSGEAYKMIVRSDATGALHTFTGGTGGGPGDGIFAWPFPLDQVTSEFRSPERPDHDGIDFGIGPSNTVGTPIPSMGAGVVYDTLSVSDGTHGWGNGVIIDHGSDPLYGGANIKTLYAHMNTAPVVSVGDPVTLGQTLGPIGNTGNSFGAHLHLEVWVDNVPVNPRTFMAAHGG